jgi:hypothetical protein
VLRQAPGPASGSGLALEAATSSVARLAGRGAGPDSEIEAFALLDHDGFRAWRSTAREQRERVEREAVRRFADGVTDEAEVEKMRQARPVAQLVRDDAHRREVRDLRTWVDEREREVRAALQAEAPRSPAQRRTRLEGLRRTADSVRFALAGRDPERMGLPDARRAIEELMGEPAALEPAKRGERSAILHRVVEAEQFVVRYERGRPGGIFISTLDYEMRCFAAAVQGVLRGNWGFRGSAFDADPSMLGSIASAGSGVLWLVTQRPGYTIVYGLVHLLVCAFFGPAICRTVAVQSARGESLPLRRSVGFACEKYGASVSAVLFPIAVVLGVAVLLWAGGLVTAIPFLGPILAGVTYGLALLAGLAIALALLGLVLGGHLLWPTIAVEASDMFDSVSRAMGYLGTRAWNLAFYALVLLLYGGVAFGMMRVVALLLLKSAHSVTDAGMSWFGAWSSAQTSSLTRLDAMWHMPAWNELPLLPSVGEMPFWGVFAAAPLSGSEAFASWCLSAWVFLVVGVLGAFVINFYFCGSTEMYLLLRRDVDSIDYDEIYYEEEDTEDFGESSEAEASAPASSSHGTSLPVMGSAPPSGA